jgi:uncharacterized protein (DUF58 family)
MEEPASADALLKRLEWTVIRRLDGLLQGDYRTLWRGAGLDLADLREYQHHDDVRHIDWNVTARLQVPHVRQFTEDRELSAWFVLDLSASVDFGSGEQSKRDLLAQFVAVLARLLTRHGNRVGAMLYARQLDAVIPARASRLHVLHLLARVMQRSPEPALTQGKAKNPTSIAPGQTRLGDLLQAAAGHIKRRSVVFVVSDFITAPGWEKPLAQLAQRHEVVAVRLVDPAERHLPDLGFVNLQDPETGEQLFVDLHNAGIQKRFAALAVQHEASLLHAFGRAGVDALELSTDEPLIDTLVRFTQLRKQRLRGRAGAVHRALPEHLTGHLSEYFKEAA